MKLREARYKVAELQSQIFKTMYARVRALDLGEEKDVYVRRCRFMFKDWNLKVGISRGIQNASLQFFFSIQYFSFYVIHIYISIFASTYINHVKIKKKNKSIKKNFTVNISSTQ